MKLIIQIPCLNEADQLPTVLAQLPREVPGCDTVEWLIIDDGSTDATVEIAKQHGVDHLVRLAKNKGLARAFSAGLDASLKLGADIVVNTDADNQYDARDIAVLVKPIVEGRADLVVGDRQVLEVEEFSWTKQRLEWLGSSVIRRASGVAVADAASGFRAYGREAALHLVVLSRYTYTLETLLQAGQGLVSVENVPIRTNKSLRESRLHTGMRSYVRRNAGPLFRMNAFYRPLRTFLTAAALLAVAAIVAWLPFLVDWIGSDGGGHIQSVVLGGVLSIAAVQVAALGLIGDLLANQRALSLDTHERVRRLELVLGVPPSHYETGRVEHPVEDPASS